MATRFYFPEGSTHGSAVTPTPDSEWEETTGHAQLRMHPGRLVTAFSDKTVSEAAGTTAGTDGLIAQYVSDPLDGAQTISGTVKGMAKLFENSTSADMRSQVVIRVVSEDGSTVRGTLLAADTSALSNEWGASNSSRRKMPLNWSAPGTSLSSVSAQDGDRIVVEIGFRSHNSLSTVYTGSMRLGDAAGSVDAPETEATSSSAERAWLEFSQTLVFRTGYVGSTAVNANSGASLAIDVPSGVEDDDFLVLVVQMGLASSDTCNTPSGWSLLTGLPLTFVGEKLYVFTRVASSEPASYTVTRTDSTRVNQVMLAYRGIDPTNPIDVSGTTAWASSVNNRDAPDVTTTVSNAVLLGIWATASGGGTNIVPPSSMAEHVDHPQSTSQRIAVAAEIIASAGATGVRNATGGSGTWCAVSIAIAPLALPVTAIRDVWGALPI